MFDMSNSFRQTLDSQSFHHVSIFQFPKKKCGNQERSCQTNWFQTFSLLHNDTRLVSLVGTEGTTEKCFRQKLCEMPALKDFDF